MSRQIAAAIAGLATLLGVLAGQGSAQANDACGRPCLTGFADRILPLDLAAARRVASLHGPDQAPQRDALIAGTALSRGLTVVTRNTRDFERTGVEYLNPWSDN